MNDACRHGSKRPWGRSRGLCRLSSRSHGPIGSPCSLPTSPATPRDSRSIWLRWPPRAMTKRTCPIRCCSARVVVTCAGAVGRCPTICCGSACSSPMGARATNTGGFPQRPPDFEIPPQGPVMHSGGGGGGDRHWHQSQWVWPLPPRGPRAFVCQWPAAGIPLTRHELDAQLILDAAARAQAVFPDAPDQGGASVVQVAEVGISHVRPSTSPG